MHLAAPWWFCPIPYTIPNYPFSSASIGRGYLEGTGNVASNGTSYVLSNYETGKGPAQMVGTYGQSMGNNSGSALNITNTGNVLTGNQTTTNGGQLGFGRPNP